MPFMRRYWRAGQVQQTEAALERARKTLAQLESDEPAAVFDADRPRGLEGLCALHTGEASRAQDDLGRSLVTLDRPRDAVRRGIVGTDLALARLRLGDPVACADLIHGTVDLTAQTGGRVPARRIRQVRRELRSWRAESFIVDLDDHINDVLLGR